MKKIFLNWLAVILWLGVIYYFSSQPDLKSELAPAWDLVFRKIAHLAEFFVLAYFFFRAYRSLNLSIGRSLFLAFVFSLVYAFFDEWHQSLVVGRSSSLIDVGIGSLGILIFVILSLLNKQKNSFLLKSKAI